jgi:hypothetical protein
MYEMHLGGILKLRDFGQTEFRSEGTEDFATKIQMLDDQIKGKL